MLIKVVGNQISFPKTSHNIKLFSISTEIKKFLKNEKKSELFNYVIKKKK